MKSFNQVFFRGLITLLPITLTIYILYSAIVILENLLGSVLRATLPEAYYIPGFGVLLTLSLIYAFGLLLNNYVTGRVLIALEDRLRQVPFLKAIYSPLKDLMNLFSQQQKSMGAVVLVKLGNTDAQFLGIVTREKFSDLQIPSLPNDKIAVYVPFSYALGGYTVLVPRACIEEIHIPIEKAMSLAITGWLKTEQNHESPSESNASR